ncbi:MAG: tetratricopeptide repeat protein [Gammaproteobacteria bacterium]
MLKAKTLKMWLAFVVSMTAFVGQAAEAPADVNTQDLVDRGALYWSGNGIARDVEKACALFEEAANLGNAYAQYGLGNCYRTGQGKPKDLPAALRQYELAAASGDLSAKLALANLYLYDASVDLRQPTVAIQLLNELVVPTKRSFIHDNVRKNAELVLGTAYYRGLGVEKNDETAVAWYELAAEHGNPLAQVLLYEIYSGRTDYKVPANVQRAKFWRDTYEMLEELQAKMQPGEVRTLSAAIHYLTDRGWVAMKTAD